MVNDKIMWIWRPNEAVEKLISSAHPAVNQMEYQDFMQKFAHKSTHGSLQTHRHQREASPQSDAAGRVTQELVLAVRRRSKFRG